MKLSAEGMKRVKAQWMEDEDNPEYFWRRTSICPDREFMH